VFYLFAIGVGLGGSSGTSPVPPTKPGGYAAFLAPALMAAAAMNGAIYESTFNIFFKLRYGKTVRRDAGHPGGSLPTSPSGRSSWCQLRGFALRRRVPRRHGAMGLAARRGRCSPCRPRCSSGSPSPRSACSADLPASWQDFDCAARHPAAVPVLGDVLPAGGLPRVVQPVVQLSPLYHGVALLRSLTLGVSTSGCSPTSGSCWR
jgi:lipooligosaccharide transport system permease protein